MKYIKSFLIIISLLSIQAAKQGYEIGDVAHDFSLKNIDGNFVALADYKEAKGFIVIFDCNTCPVSRLYNARIIALHKKYSELGFPVVAINANDVEKSAGDSYEEMVREAKTKKYSFAYLHDEQQEIARAFGATNTPHVFLLDKQDGKLILVYKGAIDNNARDPEKADKKYLENALNAVLNHMPVPVAKTKAIGCGIKWK